jgi:hypothetical protein
MKNFIILLAVFFGGMLGGLCFQSGKRSEEVKPYLPESITLNHGYILERDVDRLPDGFLKNNMQIIMASEFAGSSEELNEILRAYAKMKIDTLSRKNEL